ncbi:MAG TPA: hypothetical protein VFZ34_06905 [Blastocatellia bacterium]|nr:hypothetical protein [Blastocatellia bacterium]
MGKITLTITATGAGVHTKYASVYTNDRMQREFRLTVKFEPFVPKGYRVGAYLFDPTNEIEATIAPGETYAGQVGIYVSSGRVAEIKKVAVDNATFTANVETISPGKEFKLVVKSANKLPAGVHKALVKLTTDDPNQDTLEVVFSVKAGNAAATVEEAKQTAPTKIVDKKIAVKSRAKAKRN